MKRKRGAPKPLADVENAVVIIPAEPEKPEPEPEDPAVAEWNAFAQDHYELVEQLPLSLHRSFSLIRELDDLVQDNTSRIVPAARAYINLRESMLRKPKHASQRAPSGLDLLAHVSAAVEPPQPQSQPQSLPDQGPPTNPMPNLAASPSPATVAVQVPPEQDPKPDPSGPSASTNLAPAHPALVPPPPVPLPTGSRALLTLIATLASDAVRASNEKVGIANSICQTVDNHLRSLDALIVQHRSTLPPDPEPEPEPELEPPSPMVEDEEQRETIPPLRITRTGTTPTTIRIRNRSASRSKPQQSAEDSGGSSPSRKPKSAPATKGSSGSSSSKGSSRTPAQPTASAQPKTSSTPARRNRPPPRNKKTTEADDQSDERRYCYCNEVSFGEMVACDGECEREWFHLPCVGLQTAPGPDTKWYCKDCQATRNPKKKQRKN
ncbi:transcriptional regulatory protein PHO23 [Ceratobasidium sp. AG-Ba]|nr:transcriptional regulatory protein PHO23 [Ceratobasidium sp. AG-Ba]QRW14473.1 transcriptional regulatory protein PHO23 [Ceratobasidium sp. AG-Ba]